MRQGISGDTRSCSLGAVGLLSPSFMSLFPGNPNFLTLFWGGKSSAVREKTAVLCR